MDDRKAAHNSTFAIGGVSCSADSLVVAESFVLRIKFSGKIPPIANLQTVISNCRMSNPKHSMKEILNAKTSFGHFSIVFILALFICVFLYMLGIPLIYWATYGEGASSDRIDEMPIHIFIEKWGALTIILLLCAIAMTYNFNKHDTSHAKSYLITATVISALYIFRNPIIDLFIGI